MRTTKRTFISAALAAAAVITLACVVSSTALGANPAEEMAKVGTTDPKGNSWLSIQNSIQQFGHPEFILRLFLSLSLAVACAWAIAWHPRRTSLMNPLSDLEERKALILLGVVGAVVAELSGTSQTLAFVIFGIGALLRFRTLLDNPKLTGKAIMVVVVGLLFVVFGAAVITEMWKLDDPLAGAALLGGAFTAVMVGAIVPEQQGFANGLKQQIEAAGLQSRIVITGELAIEDVQRWYQRLTIYAFTSRNEGFGLTLIEAMSAGAALVAARAGAAEFVVEDGVTGVLTPPGDAEALVAALEPLMRDPVSAHAMGERARSRVLQKFSLDAEADAIAAVYRSLG